MAVRTVADDIRIAKVSQFLAATDIAKGVLFGARIAPSTPIVLYMERTAVSWLYDLDPTNTTLPLTANYLYSLCRGYNLRAMAVSGGGGGVTPVTPTTGYVYNSISDTISADSTTYQNNDLINGKDVDFVMVNDQVYQASKGDFTFNLVSGTITFISISLFAGDAITIPYNQKI